MIWFLQTRNSSFRQMFSAVFWHLTPDLTWFSIVPEATFQARLRNLEGSRVSSKCPWKVRDWEEGVTGRNESEGGQWWQINESSRSKQTEWKSVRGQTWWRHLLRKQSHPPSPPSYYHQAHQYCKSHIELKSILFPTLHKYLLRFCYLLILETNGETALVLIFKL